MLRPDETQFLLDGFIASK